MTAEHIARDTTFDRDADIRLDHVGRCMRAPETELRLSGRSHEKLVRMGGRRKLLQGYHDSRATHAIIPRFSQIIVRAVEHSKRGVRHDRISDRNAQSRDFLCVTCTYVEKDHFTWIDPGAFVRWHNMDVANAGHRFHRSL